MQEFSQEQFSFRQVIDKRDTFQSALSAISANKSKCEALIV